MEEVNARRVISLKAELMSLKEDLTKEHTQRRRLATQDQLREGLSRETKERSEALTLQQGQLDVIMKALNWL
jgi:hypothetical protein